MERAPSKCFGLPLEKISPGLSGKSGSWFCFFKCSFVYSYEETTFQDFFI